MENICIWKDVRDRETDLHLVRVLFLRKTVVISSVVKRWGFGDRYMLCCNTGFHKTVYNESGQACCYDTTQTWESFIYQCRSKLPFCFCIFLLDDNPVTLTFILGAAGMSLSGTATLLTWDLSQQGEVALGTPPISQYAIALYQPQSCTGWYPILLMLAMSARCGFCEVQSVSLLNL